MLYKKFHIYITAVVRRLFLSHMMYVVHVFSNIFIITITNLMPIHVTKKK